MESRRYGFFPYSFLADLPRLSNRFRACTPRAMGHRPSCRSCRHCIAPNGIAPGRCQLRQLPIHPDLVGDLWCHHWTARPPRLPVVGPGGAAGGASEPAQANVQLSLTSMLQEG